MPSAGCDKSVTQQETGHWGWSWNSIRSRHQQQQNFLYPLREDLASASPLRHHCLCLQQSPLHWDHLSSMSQLMAATLLSSGCSPARDGLEMWQHTSIPNLHIGLQNSASIAQMDTFHCTNTEDNFFASYQQCSCPFVKRKLNKAKEMPIFCKKWHHGDW